MQEDQKQGRKYLYDIARDAAYVLGLRPSADIMLKELILRIPNGAPVPVSPASVQNLAERLNCTDRAVRYRIQKLIELDLVGYACWGNGRRQVLRDRHGAIVHVAGIDLSPLMERAAEWAERAAFKRQEHDRHQTLRFEISRRRGLFKRIVGAGSVPNAMLEQWTRLPRVMTAMSIAALEKLLLDVSQLLEDLTHDRKQTSGLPEKTDPSYITHQVQTDICNSTPPSKQRTWARPVSKIEICGLEHIGLRQALLAAPDDWRVAMEGFGRPSWHCFVSVAFERARVLGVSLDAWSIAQNAIGPTGAAIIVMLADAKSQERGGPIKSIGGWVRRMSEKADSGTACLHRSVYGLMNGRAIE